MKIRNGFVSNSSSSSFIALGFSIEAEEKPYKEILIALGSSEEEIDKLIKEEKEKYDWDEEFMVREALDSKIYDLGEEKGIRILYGSEDGVKEDDKVIAAIIEETDSDGSYYFPPGEIMLNDSNQYYRKIMELHNALSSKSPIRILYGTRSC